MKPYTKTGDTGTTSLIGGTRVSKSDPRVEAYGTVDEFAAHLALLGDMLPDGNIFGEIPAQIADIQGDLMRLMAEIARSVPSEKVKMKSEKLEQWIDAMTETLPAVEGFIVPGGHPIVSQANLCRAVCRRAERRAIAANAPTETVIYLNRLSDWLWTAGRKIVETLSIKEKYFVF